MEPFRLRRWRQRRSPNQLSFYTCARPGRSEGPTGSVADSLVSDWTQKLPGVPGTTILSLLGRKPSGLNPSEFFFYSFCGGWDPPDERRGKPTFGQWLTRHHPDLMLEVVEHPTMDFEPIPTESLDAIAHDVKQILGAGRTVVLVDSGGEQRSGQVCKHLNLVEDAGRA